MNSGAAVLNWMVSGTFTPKMLCKSAVGIVLSCDFYLPIYARCNTHTHTHTHTHTCAYTGY